MKWKGKLRHDIAHLTRSSAMTGCPYLTTTVEFNVWTLWNYIKGIVFELGNDVMPLEHHVWGVSRLEQVMVIWWYHLSYQYGTLYVTCAVIESHLRSHKYVTLIPLYSLHLCWQYPLNSPFETICSYNTFNLSIHRMMRIILAYKLSKDLQPQQH